jgi:hypothetical protein
VKEVARKYPNCGADLTSMLEDALKKRNEIQRNIRLLGRGVKAGVSDVSFNCPSCKAKVKFDLALTEQPARIVLNWMAEQFRIRARSELGADFPSDLYATGFGGDMNLENMDMPLHFSVFLVVSTEKEPIIEFSMLVQSLSEKMLKEE